MSSHWIKVVVPLAALLAVVVVIYFTVPKPSPPIPSAGQPLTCIQPPGPFFASAANIEVALTESIKVLKAQAVPKVLDVIPQDARTLEMIGFLSCKAREQNLIKSSAELFEYTKLLGDIQAGKSIAPYVRHLGSLANLEKHLRTTPTDNFALLLSDTRGLLNRLDVDELAARDWPSWFGKFCTRYSGCLVCSPEGDAIRDKVTVSAAAKLKEVEFEGKRSVKCTP